MELEFKETNGKNEAIIRESEDEICGIWTDRDIDPVTYVRELRKGRRFDFNGCDFSKLCPPVKI